MVEVTPGVVKSSSSAFSIDAIISRDSGPVSSSTAPHHSATARLHGLPPPPRPGGSPPDARLLPPHPHRHLSPGVGGVRDAGSISPTGRPSESPTGHPAAAMDVLTGGASRHAGGVFAAHSLASQLPPHHPHFPSPGLPPSHHSHLLTSAAAAAAAASESASLFSAGKPMYSHSLHGGGGHLEGASHTAGLFGQTLPGFPGGMSPAEASGLSTLHALSASKGLHGGALHGLAAGAMPLPGVHRQFPLYSWLSRPGAYFPRYTGSEPSFLLPFRKPKRIRTAFSPSQLLRLEHAFEKNHYVVGQERKDLAVNLSLTETQVKVWFQNRRTKHKRIKTEEEQEQHRKPDCKEEGDE